MTNFRIAGLPAAQFEHLHQLSNTALAKINAQRCVVEEKPGYPCRVSLIDAEIGETVYLLPYCHQPDSSPYQAVGPIFVRANAVTTQLQENEIPLMLRHRTLSLRGYDSGDMMIETRIANGEKLEMVLDELFQCAAVDYVHIHNAGPGCFNCRVDRVVVQPSGNRRL
ncbi:MAG: DUF1203 domain-containing protein [Bacteroidota bacterium]